jgi:hypothetical protein
MLPLISNLLPWIGHTGIGDSRGRIHDFAGPYTIGVMKKKGGGKNKRVFFKSIFYFGLGILGRKLYIY